MPNPDFLYRRTAIAAALAASFPGLALGASVARVDFAVGNVTAVGADGKSRPLAKGSQIETGDTVATQQGRAQLRFVDGAYMSLQPNTEFKVEEFNFSGREDGKENVVMNLLRGGMRTITGLIGRTNRQNYRLRTEVATIGIRGTEYSVLYTNSIEIFVAEGSIVVQNDGGTLVLGSGQGATVQDSKTPPAPSGPPVLSPQGDGNQQQGQLDPPANPFIPPPPEESRPPLDGEYADAVGGYSVRNFTPTAFIAPATFAGGGPVRFVDTFEGGTLVGIGTAQLNVLGNDGIIAWGNWANGTLQTSGGSINLNEFGPAHYVAGLKATDIPTTGSGTYALLGYSASCSGAGCTTVGVGSHTLTVNFGAASTVSLNNMPVTINGSNAGTYTISGVKNIDSSGLFTPGNFAVAGPGCGNSFYGAGFLAGPGAVRAGLNWHLQVNSGSTDVNGANAYKKQ
ncbi:MAG: hypothetical protein A3G83_02530 [Betaproteobacteria bacterium RIFCSPLOWO2_12_FULL_68_20]|nr:MAG: hypothetical protein A3G83_02530 [Betaproteobacteria bacterium RIFCSPLOWO2_12_FULL_68_20]